MSQSLECPRCRKSANAPSGSGVWRRGVCASCGTELIAAAGPKEADVREYLYGPHLLRLAPGGERDTGRPR